MSNAHDSEGMLNIGDTGEISDTSDTASRPMSADSPASTINGVVNNSKSSKDQIKKPKSAKKTSSQSGLDEKRFHADEHGVYWVESDQGDKTWLSSWIGIKAVTRDGGSKEWGSIVWVKNDDGTVHDLQLTRRQLVSEPNAIIAALAAHGAQIATGQKTRERLIQYLQLGHGAQRMRSVARTGWHEFPDGSMVFVLPDQVIGKHGEEVILAAGPKCAQFGAQGLLSDWQAQVGSRCPGNSRLIMAVCIALAAPLIHLTNDESGGFHFVGRSSTGKTTAARVAASVWGPPRFMRSWRATDNGLEIAATQHSDSLLILDEMSQCDGKKVGEIAYTLANGKAKTRATKEVVAREVAQWRILFLSTGEVSLSTHMREAHQKTRAGQEVRIAEIPADANKGFGLFENIGDAADGDAFSKSLYTATAAVYGTLGPAFTEALLQHKNDWQGVGICVTSVVNEFLQSVADGQASRVARRFALAGVAGELATKWGLTGWQSGACLTAAKACFNDWASERGGLGSHESKAVLRTLRLHIQQHGASRYQPMDEQVSEFAIDDGESGQRQPKTVYHRAGFYRDTHEGRAYYILRDVMEHEILKDYQFKDAVKCLREAGVLRLDANNKNTRTENLPEFGRQRVFVVTPKIMDSAEEKVVVGDAGAADDFNGA